MSMVPYEYEHFIRNLKSLVEEGEVSMDRIDDAVLRILKLKLELDLFNNPREMVLPNRRLKIFYFILIIQNRLQHIFQKEDL